MLLATALLGGRMAVEHYRDGVSWDELLTGQQHTYFYLWGFLILTVTFINRYFDRGSDGR